VTWFGSDRGAASDVDNDNKWKFTLDDNQRATRKNSTVSGDKSSGRRTMKHGAMIWQQVPNAADEPWLAPLRAWLC